MLQKRPPEWFQDDLFQTELSLLTVVGLFVVMPSLFGPSSDMTGVWDSLWLAARWSIAMSGIGVAVSLAHRVAAFPTNHATVVQAASYPAILGVTLGGVAAVRELLISVGPATTTVFTAVLFVTIGGLFHLSGSTRWQQA